MARSSAPWHTAPMSAGAPPDPPGPGDAHDTGLTDRLGRLAAVSSELLTATDVDAVTEVVIVHMADAAGATVSSLSVQVDPSTLALIGMRGGRPGAASRWATYPVSASTPAGDAFRSGHTLVIGSADEIRERYPDVETASDGERSMICLPLRVAARTIGVVSLSFPGRRRFAQPELDFLALLADTCAQALDRIRAVADVADREAKLRFLADASAQLASSLDYESTLKAVARLAVPQFADWCHIQLLQDGVLRPIATGHPDEVLESRIVELQQRYPPDPDAKHGSYQVARTGEPELVPEITDVMLVLAAVDEDHLHALRQLQFRSALRVPLTVRGSVLGVVTWVAGEQGRRFSHDDLAFGMDLARRAATAIDNAQLHSQVRDVAIQLQRAVLPSTLPDMPGWEVAVRYLPAGRTDVGGDFYDVVPLVDGRVVAFVGDVMGRGVAAASAMAQMRSALRTLIAIDPDPVIVMAGLDRLFDQYDLNRLVTVAYAVMDPGRNEVHVINAGHPPPLLLRRDGGSSDIAADGALLLGAGGGDREVVTRTMFPGDTLLMFTDGLVERREENLEDGHRRVHDATHLLAEPDLEQGLRELVNVMHDETRDDDVAALALRRTWSATR
jgi:GAF domain-containing protein